MSKYLITYHDGKMSTDVAVMNQAKIAFGKWLQEAGKLVIDPGAPIRIVSQVAKETPSDAVEIGGYSILEAASAEQVLSILNSHPFILRGGTLQVNEIISI